MLMMIHHSRGKQQDFHFFLKKNTCVTILGSISLASDWRQARSEDLPFHKDSLYSSKTNATWIVFKSFDQQATNGTCNILFIFFAQPLMGLLTLVFSMEST